jgi:hypothetical protein
MKVSEMIGTRVDPRGEIEFDEAERDRYVSRFLAAFDADVDEDGKARLVHAVHREVTNRYDLYIAISDVLGWKFRTAIRVYLERYGNLADKDA